VSDKVWVRVLPEEPNKNNKIPNKINPFRHTHAAVNLSQSAKYPVKARVSGIPMLQKTQATLQNNTMKSPLPAHSLKHRLLRRLDKRMEAKWLI
jgi:hypothetical protein